jgi:Protein of unknown function (DUF1573)
VKALGLAVVAALLATIVVAQEKEPKSAVAGPRIRVEPESFDFGKAAQNKTLRKEFSIRNFGNADLLIESVSTTCGCTAALMDSKVVKPGGTTPLRVSLETRAYKGRVQRSVMVRSNDPEANLLEVKVEATVEAPN